MRIGLVSRVLTPSGNLRWSLGWGHGLQACGQDVELIFMREGVTIPVVGWDTDELRIKVCERGRLASFSRLLGNPIMKMAYFADSFPEDAAPEPFSWVGWPIVSRWYKHYDLLICHDPYVGLAGLSCKRLRGLPYVVFVHEAPVLRDPPGLRFLLRRWQKQVFGNALVCAATMEGTAKITQSMFGIPFRVHQFGCTPRGSFVHEKRRYVLFDTRWTRTREPLKILDIAERTASVDFVVAGSFASASLQDLFMREVKRRGLGSRITTHFGIRDDDLFSLYSQALAYVRWPARSPDGYVETGSSLGVYQALEAGCPLILTEDLSSSALFDGRPAAQVTRGDAASLASAITDLVGSESRIRAMAEDAWNLSREWSWTSRARALLDLVRSINGGGS